MKHFTLKRSLSDSSSRWTVWRILGGVQSYWRVCTKRGHSWSYTSLHCHCDSLSLYFGSGAQITHLIYSIGSTKARSLIIYTGMNVMGKFKIRSWEWKHLLVCTVWCFSYLQLARLQCTTLALPLHFFFLDVKKQAFESSCTCTHVYGLNIVKE